MARGPLKLPKNASNWANSSSEKFNGVFAIARVWLNQSCNFV